MICIKCTVSVKTHQVKSFGLKQHFSLNLILLKLNYQNYQNWIKKPFQSATSSTYFLFQGTFYDQIDGVAMSSSFGPVLANCFMGLWMHYEILWLNTHWKCEIISNGQYDIRYLLNCELDGNNIFLNF